MHELFVRSLSRVGLHRWLLHRSLRPSVVFVSVDVHFVGGFAAAGAGAGRAERLDLADSSPLVSSLGPSSLQA